MQELIVSIFSAVGMVSAIIVRHLGSKDVTKNAQALKFLMDEKDKANAVIRDGEAKLNKERNAFNNRNTLFLLRRERDKLKERLEITTEVAKREELTTQLKEAEELIEQFNIIE